MASFHREKAVFSHLRLDYTRSYMSELEPLSFFRGGAVKAQNQELVASKNLHLAPGIANLEAYGEGPGAQVLEPDCLVEPSSVWPWASDLASLCLSFLVCKMRLVFVPTLEFLVRIK